MDFPLFVNRQDLSRGSVRKRSKVSMALSVCWTDTLLPFGETAREKSLTTRYWVSFSLSDLTILVFSSNYQFYNVAGIAALTELQHGHSAIQNVFGP